MSKKSSLFAWPNVLAFCSIVLLVVSCSVCRQHKEGCVSPLDYGLKKARTGEERYEVLFKAHSEALRLGKTVDYSGIKKIDLVIPKWAKSIPLGERTDFNGVTMTVINNFKTFFLFEYTAQMQPISVKAYEVDNQIYYEQAFNKGLYLLSIQDENPWVENREGYSYGATRKDIVLIEDRKGLNGPCSTYTNAISKPSFSYRAVTKDEKSFVNLVFKRLPGSTYMTKLVKFSNENNIRIDNISISTPKGTLYGDQAVCVYDCTNVLLKDISIDGTYSTTEKFGYGISMNNVWNVACESIRSNTAWGVFGTNNTHEVHLKGCDVNRFDIHCYGKDVLCEDCTFNGTGGQYSSVFGTIEYRRCTFNNASPYLNRADYNAYVHFKLFLKDCVVNAPKTRPYLINLRTWSEKVNERDELKTKCWPDVTIENMTVNLQDGIKAFELFRVPSKYTNKKPVAGISNIAIRGMKFNHPRGALSVVFKLSSAEMLMANRMTCSLEGLELLPARDEVATKSAKQMNEQGNVIVNMKGLKGEAIRLIELLND